MTRTERSRIVLVTGASTGIGAEVAQQLAGPDTHVVVGYHDADGADGADATAAAIKAAGGHASTLAADLTDESAAATSIDALAARFGRLDALILHSSGGLGPGSDPAQAMRVNRDAQRRLARLAVPLMPVGGRIVFVTSHQAHFFPHKAVPKGYSAVAASMRAGETALYAMRSEFARAGVGLTVVSGDMIDGTTIARLLDRPSVGDVRRSYRHTPSRFAQAIAGATRSPQPRPIVFVGGAEHLVPA